MLQMFAPKLNKKREKVRRFNCLGCELSLDDESDFYKKQTDSKEYAALLGNTYRKPVQIPK